MKCPKCGGNIQRYGGYISDVCNDYIVVLCSGCCTKCETEYQWREESEIIFKGIVDFKEVS